MITLHGSGRGDNELTGFHIPSPSLTLSPTLLCRVKVDISVNFSGSAGNWN